MSSSRPVTDPVGYRSGSQKKSSTGPAVRSGSQILPVRFMDFTGPVRFIDLTGPVRFTDFTVRSGPVSGSTGTIFSAVNRMTSLVLMFNLQNFQGGILFPFYAL